MSDLVVTNTFTNGTDADADEVNQNFQDVEDKINGNIDADNLAAEVGAALGLTQDTTVRRGKSIIATEESRSNTAYGLLTTPDRVESVVLPTDGLIVVGYQALWKESVADAAKAAIFIDSNQLKVRSQLSAAPVVQEAGCDGGPNTYRALSTAPYGLMTHGGAREEVTAHTSDVTTGQALATQQSDGTTTLYGGGLCHIFASAGTYDISARFKAASGSVTVKERKLWVWTVSF